ncbi:hypothetical protein KIW84_013119 [Lathyrus oleraceus]|uniref:DUF659 domain-containing protein n=1 Tax=Pisum sativum TaxID=3888 RepID=A0A9D5BJ89_PEA|nr:hypothetical protein KIW84_013119 [Pisum sativum]
MFVKSVDASDYAKMGDKLVELLDTFVEEMGEQNVVQLITDNGSNYVAAGKILTSKRSNMFWTPCVTHCIYLMLEDMGKIPKVDKVIKNGVKVVGYIYNHAFALNLMRKITDNVELVKNGMTRFYTSFLTLQRLKELKSKLREMFICDEWVSSKCANDAKGKSATSIILMTSFWNDVAYTLKVMAPLVDVLRMVDNERKPTMGYIYATMGVAKESIERAFNSNSSKYKFVFDIIDKRWECQLHHPLHSTGYYLKPEYYYEKPEIENDHKLYKGVIGLFGIRAEIRQGLTLAQAEWWKFYGDETPDLQLLMVKVLSLGCSASGFTEASEVNEFVIYTRRSRLLEVASTSRAQQVVAKDVEKDDEDEILEEYFDDI